MSKIMGTPGNDNLRGTPQNDTLLGLAGNDTLLGLGGDDLLIDTVGNDILDGGQGNDTLSGGAGLDNLKGSAGKDILWGGAGGDRLSGNSGDDTLVGGIGSDTLDGGRGDDLLIGGGDMTLFGLTDNNMLVAFDSDRPNRAQTLNITGVSGTLIGIDFRPQDGKLYGITDTNNIYTINTTTGAAMLVSSVNPIGFNGGNQSGVDFNPTPDRLRLVGSNDENFRVNVDNGTVVDGDTLTGGIQPDTPVAYAMGDINFGADPNITGAAYTNSFSPSPDPTRR
jgi:Ca2+-binding RTX toxin-like protein